MKNFVIVALLATSACASHEKEPEVVVRKTVEPGPSIEAKQVASEQGTPYVTEIQFKTGGKDLSLKARRQIDELIAKADKDGTIEQVKVISWASEEYPSVNTRKLSKAEMDLAEDRGNEISKNLKAHGVRNLEVINMAKRPNFLQRVAQTDDFRLKKALEITGIPNTDSSVKTPSKKDHAIVIVLLR